jgi:mRNA interferase MazF
VKRGEIWWAELPGPSASEPGYKRPVLIIQADEFNFSRINTAIVIAITSNLRLAAAPGNVRLSKSATSLPKDSVANISQILTLDKRFFVEPVCQLSPLIMRQIDDGLRLILGL